MSKRIGIEINVQTGEIKEIELPEVIDEAAPK
jgi:hypothetical protein